MGFYRIYSRKSLYENPFVAVANMISKMNAYSLARHRIAATAAVEVKIGVQQLPWLMSQP